MVEIKFLKELPVRPLNINTSFINLDGGEIYADVNGDRYAYLSFSNKYGKPFFSLYLQLKQYDSAGVLIKEGKYSVPNMYCAEKQFIIEEPIAIEKECDALEVYIYLVEFSKGVFFNDKLTKRSNDVDYSVVEIVAPIPEKPFAGHKETAEAKVTTINEDGEEVEEVVDNTAELMKNIYSGENKAVYRKSKFNFIPLIALAGVIAVIVVALIWINNLIVYSKQMAGYAPLLNIIKNLIK